MRPSWPQSRVELRLLQFRFMSILLVCLGHPVSCCLLQRLKFHAEPFPLAGQLNTNVQVNNTAAPHHMYTDKHIYITFVLLFILFFTLLPFSWAGWLAHTLPVWHNYVLVVVHQYTYIKHLWNHELLAHYWSLFICLIINKRLNNLCWRSSFQWHSGEFSGSFAISYKLQIYREHMLIEGSYPPHKDTPCTGTTCILYTRVLFITCDVCYIHYK